MQVCFRGKLPPEGCRNCIQQAIGLGNFSIGHGQLGTISLRLMESYPHTIGRNTTNILCSVFSQRWFGRILIRVACNMYLNSKKL